MIRSFADKRTKKVFERNYVKDLSKELQRKAYRKLLMIEAAEQLNDLETPLGNQLEKLKGDREGQYSIRINRQWRICFRWSEGDAHDVEIVDYHGG